MKFSPAYERALAVRCPTCNSPQGYFCVTGRGKAASEPHVNRKRAAQAAERGAPA